ncbi:NUDIX domain-containing protein [Streptomyces sp. NPDC001020]
MNVWQVVAGGGEAGETPQQAAVREAREELGLDQPIPLYPLQTRASIPALFFAAVGPGITGRPSFLLSLRTPDSSMDEEGWAQPRQQWQPGLRESTAAQGMVGHPPDHVSRHRQSLRSGQSTRPLSGHKSPLKQES